MHSHQFTEHFLESVAAFNQGRFYDCHESLELLWNHCSEETERLYLQGILQIGVALHHHQNGNLTGFQNLLAKGVSKIEQLSQQQWKASQAPNQLPQVDLAQLLNDLKLLPRQYPYLLLVPEHHK